MAYQLATAFVSVQAKNGLTAAFSQIKSQVGSLLSGIGNISPVLGAVAGFAGLTYAISNAMGAAEDAIDAEARLNAVIRATGNAARLSSADVLAMSSKLQAGGIFSDTDITKATTALIQMRAITRETFPEIIKLSEDVAASGFGSVENAARTLGRALSDPARGLFRLRSIGVTFTQQEQMQIRALAKANDLFGAQKIILDKLRNSLGGVADARFLTPAGQWKNIKNQLASISQELGVHILPIAVHIGREVLKITQAIAPLVNRILDIDKNLKGWPSKILLAALASYVMFKGVNKVVSALKESYSYIGSIVQLAMANPWTAGAVLVVAGLVAEYSAIWFYLNKFPKFTEAWNKLLRASWVAIKQIWDAMKEVGVAMLMVAEAALPEWVKQLPIIKQLLEQGIVGALVYIIEHVAKGITVLGAFLKTIGQIFAETVKLGVLVYGSVAGAFSTVHMHAVRIYVVMKMIGSYAGQMGTMFDPMISALDVVINRLLTVAGLARIISGTSGLIGKSLDPSEFVKLYNENLRGAKLDIKRAELDAKRKQKQMAGAGGPSGLNGGILDIAPGLSGLQDAWKNVQEALLKKESPMERAASGIESLDETADRMLTELASINGKITGNNPVVAGV